MNKEKLHRIRSRVLWTVAMATIAFLLVASIQRKNNQPIDKVVVAIKPIKGDNNLITPEDVGSIFKQYLGYDIGHAQIKDLNLSELEDLLNSDQRVKLSHVFLDGFDRINVWILQRQPVVRVMEGSKAGYYLDDEGKQLTLINKKAIRVPVATGRIELYDPNFLKDEEGSKLKEVFEIAKFIQEDPLLSSLIEQIDVENENEIVLIPKIGRHELTLGDAHNLDEKFDNLKIMYKEGLPRAGWRKYSVLKLNYKGQVVAKLDQ